MILILPIDSFKRENQNKHIFKLCLWLTIRIGVKQEQCSKNLIYYTYRRLCMIILSALVFSSCIKQPNIDVEYSNSNFRSESLIQSWINLTLAQREDSVIHYVSKGYTPDFNTRLQKVRFEEDINGKKYKVTIWTLPDYFSLGSDKDYFYIGLTPDASIKISKMMNCTLPTKKLVDTIWARSEIKLSPQPIPPSDSMTRMSVLYLHNKMVKHQLDSLIKVSGIKKVGNKIRAGHKKDIVQTLVQTPGKVNIYGWHKKDGIPIQPLYSRHADTWVDYSHGLRLISMQIVINGKKMLIDEVLRNNELRKLVTD